MSKEAKGRKEPLGWCVALSRSSSFPFRLLSLAITAYAKHATSLARNRPTTGRARQNDSPAADRPICLHCLHHTLAAAVPLAINLRRDSLNYVRADDNPGWLVKSGCAEIAAGERAPRQMKRFQRDKRGARVESRFR
jgi:hypothetical protein